jgi:hypothetical protein
MNKDHGSKRKLVLHRATVRHLTGAELKGVAGGMIDQSILTKCDCETVFCPPSSQGG